MKHPYQRAGNDYVRAEHNEALFEAREALDPLLAKTGDYIAALALQVRANALTVMRSVPDDFGYPNKGTNRLWRGEYFFAAGDKGLLLSSIRVQDRRESLRRRLVGTHVSIRSHIAATARGHGPTRENDISSYGRPHVATSTHIIDKHGDAQPKQHVKDYVSPDALQADYARSCLTQLACATFIDGIMQYAVRALNQEPESLVMDAVVSQELQ